MKTLKEYAAKIAQFLSEHPEAGDMPCVSVDAQCCHHEPSGPFVRELRGWPREYCLHEQLPEGTTQFVQV